MGARDTAAERSEEAGHHPCSLARNSAPATEGGDILCAIESLRQASRDPCGGDKLRKLRSTSDIINGHRFQLCDNEKEREIGPPVP